MLTRGTTTGCLHGGWGCSLWTSTDAFGSSRAGLHLLSGGSKKEYMFGELLSSLDGEKDRGTGDISAGSRDFASSFLFDIALSLVWTPLSSPLSLISSETVISIISLRVGGVHSPTAIVTILGAVLQARPLLALVVGIVGHSIIFVLYCVCFLLLCCCCQTHCLPFRECEFCGNPKMGHIPAEEVSGGQAEPPGVGAERFFPAKIGIQVFWPSQRALRVRMQSATQDTEQ